MTPLFFVQLVKRNVRLLLLSGLISASIVFYLTSETSKQYTSSTVINTGVVSGYTIENHNSDVKTDRDYSRNELQILTAVASSYETMEELSLRLIATYCRLETSDPQWISIESYEEVSLLFTESLLKKVDLQTYESAYESLMRLRDIDKDEELLAIIYSDHPFFGIEHLESIKTVLKGSSDLLEFSYTTEDAAVCQKTLELLTQIFLEKHRILKESQSEDVLKYFEDATNASAELLKDAENKLLRFRVQNSIINYYEQTRFIADKKEDLDELYFKEVMTLEAAAAAKKRLDQQLEERGMLSEMNSTILLKRKELSDITTRIALLEFLQSSSSEDVQEDLKQNQVLLASLEDEIGAMTTRSQRMAYSREGVPVEDFLTKWLSAMIQVEESRSRIAVLEERKKEFTNIYQKFAPWGSQLKKIEREIALAEDAYLENLHSFNQARLHLQNTIMSSNLKILDAPFFPTRDLGSKRLLFVMVALLAGILLPLMVLILLEFVDRTMQNPIEASSRLGLPLFGAFPYIPQTTRWRSRGRMLDFLSLQRQCSELLAKNVVLKMADGGSTKVFGVTSMRGTEGTSHIAKLLSRSLRQSDRVLHLTTGDEEPVHMDSRSYDPSSFKQDMTLVDLNGETSPAIEAYDYVIIEIPSLLKQNAPAALMSKLDYVLVTCRANRVWSHADEHIWETLKEKYCDHVSVLVNGVRPEVMEDFIGELPKHRSRLRRKLKEYLKLNFSGKSHSIAS